MLYEKLRQLDLSYQRACKGHQIHWPKFQLQLAHADFAPVHHVIDETTHLANTYVTMYYKREGINSLMS